MKPETTAYPLSWPLGRPRATLRKTSLFSTTLAKARDGLLAELDLMGADDVILSANLELRRDGLPYATKRQPADPGVCAYFTWREQSYALGCDCWDKVEDNMQAIRKTVEALRGIARWGTGEMMAAAFVGFKALPEQVGPDAGRAWWQVLGVEHNDGPDTINAAYRALAKQAHPDAGGSHERMVELNAARDAGLKQNPF